MITLSRTSADEGKEISGSRVALATKDSPSTDETSHWQSRVVTPFSIEVNLNRGAACRVKSITQKTSYSKTQAYI